MSVTYELTPCPVCGAPDGAELADAAAMQREVELLWEFHERRLKAGVPPEHLTDRLIFSQYPPIRLAECLRCSHVYRNPWERKLSLKAAYADTSAASGVLDSVFESQRGASRSQVRRLTEVAGRPGRGLEIGSYVGSFLAAASDAGWTFEGMDVNEDAAELAARKGLRVSQGEIEERSGSGEFDAIAIWNTFEQLYDARAALTAARRLLREGGTLALRIPNGRFYRVWRRRLDGSLHPLAVRLLGHNNLLTFPYRQGFTRGSLEALLAQTGFSLVSAFGDTLVPVADRWTTGYGVLEERWIKRAQRLLQPGWNAPWVEVYAAATEAASSSATA